MGFPQHEGADDEAETFWGGQPFGFTAHAYVAVSVSLLQPHAIAFTSLQDAESPDCGAPIARPRTTR